MVVDGREMNPRLHLTIHEIVAAQLADDDPPEVWATAQRLRRLGYGRHEILHMLGAAMTPQLWAALHDQREYDLDEHRAALAALPDSWERERPGGPRPRRARRARRRRREAAQGRACGTPPQPASLRPRSARAYYESWYAARDGAHRTGPARQARGGGSRPAPARRPQRLGRDPSCAPRGAARRRSRTALRAEAEEAAADPADRAESARVRAEMDALAAPWPEA